MTAYPDTKGIPVIEDKAVDRGAERLDVPLSQLKAIAAEDEETQQAVEDWRYWVGRGYQF